MHFANDINLVRENVMENTFDLTYDNYVHITHPIQTSTSANANGAHDAASHRIDHITLHT